MFRLTSLLVLLVFTACTKTWVAPQYARPGAFATWVDTPRSAYKIEPGDDVSVVLPFNAELNYEAPVAPDGGLTIPLAGTIPAAGLTVAQVASNVDRALEVNGITKNAYASVSIRTFAGQLYVSGQVKKPGPVPIQNDMDVLQAISAAGGLMDTARSKEVVVIRRAQDGRPMLRTVDLEALTRRGDPTQEVVLQPFDTIFVPQSSVVEADQWIDRYITRVVPFNQSINYNIGQGGFFR
ncbi:polysaccharide biosynthesis/export family protein [Acetobacter sp. TBRC 12305]|uniref:polysaccharide biosynthesis/export family protein n=1 Tax=Acetobacter garciniae TaxID=2817435 RepID=UPI001C738CB6|nr:polysaccharide biosynthesis/export family protein [Acetobacter garciniae]MBX0345070.1 polysaccharide biosynthesis/export family protein [Acetobacter garciniae]